MMDDLSKLWRTEMLTTAEFYRDLLQKGVKYLARRRGPIRPGGYVLCANELAALTAWLRSIQSGGAGQATFEATFEEWERVLEAAKRAVHEVEAMIPPNEDEQRWQDYRVAIWQLRDALEEACAEAIRAKFPDEEIERVLLAAEIKVLMMSDQDVIQAVGGWRNAA